MIDPIISAIVAGAAKSAIEISSDALMSAYKTLKSYLAKNYTTIDINKLERDPDDDGRRTRLATALREAMVDKDTKLQELAIDVLQQVANEDSGSSAESILDDPDGPLPVNLDIDSKIPLIQRFPVGPPVPTHLIPMEDLADALSDEVNQARMVALIKRTEALRIKHDPEGAKRAATVNIHDLPNPDGGVYDFWFQAIDEACRKGPRTLASFLLSLPMGAWMLHGRNIFKALEREY
jgi:hypothetical protein